MLYYEFLDSPRFRRKQDPLTALAIGGAIASGVGGLASVFGNTSSTKSTNRANMQINREQIAAQKALQADQQRYQTEMWNKTNEYNAPQAEVERLREAGLNPYLQNSTPLGSNATMPSAPSVPSPASQIAMQPTDYSGLSQIGSGVMSGVGALLQAEQIQSTKNLQGSQSIQSLVNSATEIYEKFGEKAGKEFLDSYLPIIASRADFSGSLSTDFIRSQIEVNRANTRLQAANAEVVEKFGLKKAQAVLDTIDQEITESVARIGKMASDAKVNDAKIKELAADTMMKIAQKSNLDADTETINAIRGAVVAKAEHEATVAHADAIEAASVSNSRKSLRQWRQLSSYRYDVAVAGAAEETATGQAVTSFAKALGAVIPAKAAAKRGVKRSTTTSATQHTAGGSTTTSTTVLE